MNFLDAEVDPGRRAPPWPQGGRRAGAARGRARRTALSLNGTARAVVLGVRRKT